MSVVSMQRFIDLDASETVTAVDGSPVEFEQFVAEQGSSLLRLAYVLTGDSHAAQDLVQTALVDVFRHWRKVCAAESQNAYVRRMLVNAHLSRMRRRSSTELPVSGPTDVIQAPTPDFADTVAVQDQVRRALNTLAPRARATLVLRYFLDLDDHAIAELMGVSHSAVRGTASRALATLRTEAGVANLKETP